MYVVSIDKYPPIKMSFIEAREVLLLRGYNNKKFTPNYLSSLNKLIFNGVTINIIKGKKYV